MAGIEISIPEVIKDYDACTFRANKTDGMIEVIFQNGDDEIRFRKGLGGEDISGDYNEYAQIETVDGVTLKGVDGQFSLPCGQTVSILILSVLGMPFVVSRELVREDAKALRCPLVVANWIGVIEFLPCSLHAAGLALENIRLSHAWQASLPPAWQLDISSLRGCRRMKNERSEPSGEQAPRLAQAFHFSPCS